MKKSYVLGLLLFSSTILSIHQSVQAEEMSATSISKEEIAISTPEQAFNQAVQQAKNSGVIITEGPPSTFSNNEQIQQNYLEQTKYLQETTSQFLLEKENYTVALEQYQKTLEHEAKQQKIQELHNRQIQEATEQYQKDIQEYTIARKQYEIDLQVYQKNSQINNSIKKQYDQAIAQYEKELATFKELQIIYNKEKAEQEKALKDYQKRLSNYENEKLLYEKAKEEYDKAFSQAQENTKNEGHLSQVYAQYLIAKSEPNATVFFENIENFIDASHQFGEGLNGIGSPVSSLPLSNTPTLFKSVGSSTAAGSGDGYGVILHKNKPITVIYEGLENTSYDGKKITSLVYTYELISTFSDDGKATAFIYTDPTKTIYTGSAGNNRGDVDFSIHQTMTYFLENGEAVVFDKNATALLSFASRNNTFEFGEQEFVQMDDNMSFIPITGSSVSEEAGFIASRGSNNSKADGSKYDRNEWDSDGHPNEYFGAGVVQVTGDTISFLFGIRYSQEDIDSSANPTTLRNRSRQWFTVNSDIKAAGLLSVRKPGTAPIKPLIPAILEEELLQPIEPIRPDAPKYINLLKPVEPKRPYMKNFPVIQWLVTKGVKPVEPLSPIVLIHRNIYQAPTSTKATSHHQKTNLPSTYYAGLNQFISPSIRPNYQYYTPLTPPTTQLIPPSKKKLTISFKFPPPSLKLGKQLKRDYFGENTGITKISGDQEKLFKFIDQVGKTARKKNKFWKFFPPLYDHLVNKDISLALAHEDYSKDSLQKLFNTFGEDPKSTIANDGKDILSDNHNHSKKLDISHTMTTLASIHNSGVISSGIKSIASFLKLFPSSTTTVLQLNSLVGDLFTDMDLADINSDLDAIILSKHPDYKNLPMDQRIVKYFSQRNLDKKRKDLYLEVYSKDASTAKFKASLEIVGSLVSIGGLGLLGYATATGKSKNLGKNIELLDKEIFDGSLSKFINNPLKTTLEFGKHQIDRGIKKISNLISNVKKETTKFFKNIGQNIDKGIKNIKNFFKPSQKQAPKTRYKTPKQELRMMRKNSSKNISNITTKGSRKIRKNNTRITRKAAPKVTRKTPPKAAPKVIRKTPPKTASRVTRKAPPKTAPKVTRKAPPKTAPKVTRKAPPKAAPKVTRKAPPKAAPKVTRKAPPKTAPKVTRKAPPKAAPKVTRKTLPKAAPKVTRKAPPKAAPKVTRKTAPKQNPRVTHRPAPKQNPRVAHRPAPKQNPRVAHRPAPKQNPRVAHRPTPKQNTRTTHRSNKSRHNRKGRR